MSENISNICQRKKGVDLFTRVEKINKNKTDTSDEEGLKSLLYSCLASGIPNTL